MSEKSVLSRGGRRWEKSEVSVEQVELVVVTRRKVGDCEEYVAGC